ncbi:MAG: class I SAM-dependent methyltransferase [Verrucomicrobiia bacterium]|jgi:SAM-dependent methyltransferase
MNSLGKLAHGISHFLNRLRFGKGDSYEAGAFWEYRHARYQSDFRAVADSSDDAHDRYPKQKAQLLKFLDTAGIKLAGGVGCTEFGCGNGFWAKVVLEAGAQSYTGLDISPTAVGHCKQNVPGGVFARVDLGGEDYAPQKPADLVFSIDVTQHIVEEVKLGKFLQNMVAAVKPGGHIVLTTYAGFGDRYTDDDDRIDWIGRFIKVRKLRWVYAWDLPTLKKHLKGCELIAASNFWEKTIFAFVRRCDSKQAVTAPGR